MAGRVLVVDDEKNITFVIQAMLDRAGFETVTFNDSAEAMRAMDDDWDVVITDLYMPGPGGMEVLTHCQKTAPQLPVVVITAFGTVEAAVSALKQGAFDFITKPFEQTELLSVVQKAVATHQQRRKEPAPPVPPADLRRSMTVHPTSTPYAPKRSPAVGYFPAKRVRAEPPGKPDRRGSRTSSTCY